MPSIYSRIALVLGLLVPVVALTTRNGSTIVSYAFVALTLVVLATQGLGGFNKTKNADIKLMAIILFCPLVSMCITSAYYGVWSGSEFEKNLRIALSLGAYWLLTQIPSRYLQHIQWSLLIAAISSSVVIIALMMWHELGRSAFTEFGAKQNAIAFANLTLFFGFSSLLMLGWTMTPWRRLEAAVKIGAGLLAVYAVVLSETRSSWMLLPVFLFVVILLARHWPKNLRRACVIGGTAVLLAAVIIVPKVSNRMAAITDDISSYVEDNHRDTSIGIRMQLWVASWHMAQKNLLLGVGGSAFPDELKELAKQGVVTPRVAKDFGEPHSDIISAFSAYGLLGLLALLALYLAPAVVFIRRIWSTTDNRIKVAASIGLLLCLGYTAFSLTEMMFRGMRSVTVYTIMLGTFMALTRRTD